jgi:RNA 2',3'-cyclic 3'-phosphodiesterase
MCRRLFFALWPDEATRMAVHRSTRALVRHSGGRPVPPENYHLTLAFLGNVPEEQCDVVRAAANACPLQPLTLRLDTPGYFPGARVLWIGPRETPEALAQLAAGLSRAMLALGLHPETQAFNAHLTLARKVALAPGLPVLRGIDWPVSGFALVESRTTPGGVRYEVLAWYPATAAPRESV